MAGQADFALNCSKSVRQPSYVYFNNSDLEVSVVSNYSSAIHTFDDSNGHKEDQRLMVSHCMYNLFS